LNFVEEAVNDLFRNVAPRYALCDILVR